MITTVVLLIGAIYFPSLSTSKASSQEKEAKRNLAKIYGAELEFFHQRGWYGSLDELIESELIEPSFSSRIKSKYCFEIEAGKDGFEAYATPERYGINGFTSSGRLSFYINEERVLTYADKQGAKATVRDKQLDE